MPIKAILVIDITLQRQKEYCTVRHNWRLTHIIQVPSISDNLAFYWRKTSSWSNSRVTLTLKHNSIENGRHTAASHAINNFHIPLGTLINPRRPGGGAFSSPVFFANILRAEPFLKHLTMHLCSCENFEYKSFKGRSQLRRDKWPHFRTSFNARHSNTDSTFALKLSTIVKKSIDKMQFW